MMMRKQASCIVALSIGLVFLALYCVNDRNLVRTELEDVKSRMGQLLEQNMQLQEQMNNILLLHQHAHEQQTGKIQMQMQMQHKNLEDVDDKDDEYSVEEEVMLSDRHLLSRNGRQLQDYDQRIRRNTNLILRVRNKLNFLCRDNRDLKCQDKSSTSGGGGNRKPTKQPTSGSCAKSGSKCAADDDCCSDLGCQFDETCGSCKKSKESCSVSDDCCIDLKCDNKRCSTSCRKTDQSCTASADCCSGLTCNNKKCIA